MPAADACGNAPVPDSAEGPGNCPAAGGLSQLQQVMHYTWALHAGDVHMRIMIKQVKIRFSFSKRWEGYFGARFNFASVRLGSWMCMEVVLAYFVATSSNLVTNQRASKVSFFFSTLSQVNCK
jgi:hypothetical protein